MGLIRTYLAVCVMIGHSYGPLLIDGRFAVQLFYVLSGFLMAATLSTGKYEGNISRFYLRRLERLFPFYIFVFMLTLLFFGETFINFWSLNDVWISLWYYFSKVSLVSQDLVFFVNPETLTLERNFAELRDQLWKSMLIPQSWTLSLELYFYLIVPFLVRSRIFLLAVFSISIVIRYVLIKDGLGLHDPWTYRFFPAEVSTFIGGVLIFYLARYFERYLIKFGQSKLVHFFLMGLILSSFGWFEFSKIVKLTILGLYLLAIPLSFYAFRDSKIDAYISEYSYPVYISHYFAIYIYDAKYFWQRHKSYSVFWAC